VKASKKVVGIIAGTAIVTALAGAGTAAYAAANSPRTVQTLYSCENSTRTLKTALTEHSQSCPVGMNLVQLNTGSKAGGQGPQGPAGPQGIQGPKGDTGAAGTNAQALPYGIGQVLVDRGTGPAVWETLSTTLGSPAGDTTGGSFRFTCKTTECQVSAKAYATATGYQAYPRIILHKQLADGAMAYCEYADGADNNGSSDPVGTTATAVTLGIGGTLDCGSTQAYPANGVAAEITVPASTYYDVDVTWTFTKVS